MSRKGDLVLVESVSRASFSAAAIREARDAGRELETETVSYTFGVVASATRDGLIKTWCEVGYGDELVSTYAQPVRPGDRFWTMTSKEIDVQAVMAAAKEHHWPGHPGQPQPFATLAQARSVVRRIVRGKG